MCNPDDQKQCLGDIDPEFNVVEVTEEAKKELAKIDNKVCDTFCLQLVFDCIVFDVYMQ